MKIKVMGLWAVEDFINKGEFNPDEKFAIITVTDSDVNFRNIPQLVGWMTIPVDDIEEGDQIPKGSLLFNEFHARAVKKFVESKKDEVDFFIVHCNAGMSRSPALAAALSLAYNGNDEEFFRNKTPNRTIYKRMLETYGLSKEPVFDLPENCKLCEEKLSNSPSTKLIGVHDNCLLKGEWK